MDNNDDLLAWKMGQLRRQGYTTAARGTGRAGQSLTDEQIIWASTLNDTHTVGWYIAGDGSATYMTKDGSDLVSVWNDLSGNVNHLLQATGTNQPKWESDGVLFDGSDNYMATADFTWNRPEFTYIVLKRVTWTNNDYIMDGKATNNMAIYMGGSNNIIGIWTTTGFENNTSTLGQFEILRVLSNGVSSSIQVNNLIAATGNGGTGNASGFTLGARGQKDQNYGNIQVKEIILRNSADSAATQTSIYNYLANKYGFTTI